MSPFEGKCGELQGGTCAEPPPISPSGCPGVGSGGLSVPGCCAANGMCGIDISQFTMLPDPCIDLATAGAFMGPGGDDGGISFELPDPRPCPTM